MRYILLFICIFSLFTLYIDDVASSSPKIIYQQYWNDSKNPKEIKSVVNTEWYNLFVDNSAWVISTQSKTRNSYGMFSAIQDPPIKNWYMTGINAVMSSNPINGSLWVPFGDYGVNAVRHDFKKPYPTTGTLKVSIWTKRPVNLRQRGIYLILQKGNGETATVAYGLWAGTDCPSYSISGIKPISDLSDGVFHRIPEIKISQHKSNNEWHNFIIDIGDTAKNSIIFKYSTTSSKEQRIKKSINIAPGKDYKYIKSIVIGALPYSSYAGSNSNSDQYFFVDNVIFSKK